MSARDLVEDDAAIPSAVLLRVHNDLVAVPRLDGREEPFAVLFAHADVARAQTRRLLDVPGGQQRLLELQVLAAAARAIERDPLEARDEELIAVVAVPLHRAHAMDDAGNVGGDDVALPVLRAVPEHRRLVLIVGGRDALLADERRVQELLPAVAVEIGPRDVMRRGKLVDLLHFPRLPRIAARLREPVEAGAVGRLHRERALERDLGNAVAVDVGDRLVDDLLRLADDDVALPRRVLVPCELLHLQRVRDDVRLAVLVEVRDGDAVAAPEARVDVVRRELDGAGRRRAAERRGRCADDGGEKQLGFHAADYRTRGGLGIGD